jgi:hypothetical protein
MKRLGMSGQVGIPLLVSLGILLAFVILNPSPEFASRLLIVPDSTEYVLGAHRFAETGNYQILIDGQWLPPRYPPWFPLLAISPSFVLFGGDLPPRVVPRTKLVRQQVAALVTWAV